MKESAKILTIIMVVFFGFATIVGSGDDLDEPVQVIPADIGVFKLIYLRRSSEPVQISVLNSHGDLLESDHADSYEKFIREYDLSKHGSGEYVFRTEDDEGLKDYKIYYESTIGLTLYRMGQCNKFKLNVEKPTGSLLISIYKFNGQLIEQDRINSSKPFSRVYDLTEIENLNSGLSFVVVDDSGIPKEATF